MANQTSIGKNIKAVRQEQGLTQRELSERSGITISQLSSYENGKQMPGLVSLGNLATALGTSIDRLYFGSPSEAFLNESIDFGETVVNCFAKLWGLGVLQELDFDEDSYEFRMVVAEYGPQIQRLFSMIGEYCDHRDYFADGEAYLKQVKKSIVNEINAMHR